MTTLALLTTLTLASDHPIEFGLAYAPGDDSGDVMTGFASVGVLGGVGARFEYTKNINDGDLFSSESVSRYALFAVYDLALSENISLTPKMGIVKNDASVKIGDVFDSVSGSSTEFTYGLELNYNYNENMAFFVGYTDYGNDFDFDAARFDSDYMDSASIAFGVKFGL